MAPQNKSAAPVAENLLLITTHYRPLEGGALTVYDSLARAITNADSGHRLSILTSWCSYFDRNNVVSGWEIFDAEAPYPIYRTGALMASNAKRTSRLRDISRAWRLFRTVLILHLKHRYTGFILAPIHHTGWLVPVLQGLTGKKVACYLHGEEVSTYIHNPQGRQFSLGLRADILFVVSRFTYGLVARLGVAPEKLKILPNGVDLARLDGAKKGKNWRKSLALSKKDILVLAAGRLVPRKGFDYLIKAFNQVALSHPHIHLVIAGTGELTNYIKQAASDPKDKIHYVGRLEDADLNSLYRDADIFALPNRTLENGDTEGFGLVFLEAGLFSTPGIGGLAGGVPDAIIHGKTGLLVNSKSVDDIADGLRQFVENPKKRRQYGVAAKRHALKQSWDKRGRALIASFSRVRSMAMRSSKS